MAAPISHGPLCHRLDGDTVVYFCDCGFTTAPQFSIEGALLALESHIRNPDE